MSPLNRFIDGRLRRTFCVLREQGVGWAAFRVWDAAQRRMGMIERRMPKQSWSHATLKSFGGDDSYASQWLASPPPFFFNAALVRQERAFREVDPNRTAVAESDAISQGRWEVLGEVVDGQFPPQWHTAHMPIDSASPTSKPSMRPVTFPSDQHWSTIDTFASGDIKRLWEPARFGAAFSFVRASVQATIAPDLHMERFWTLAESFYDNNPPNHGPHWKCGQEVSLRLIAWCFGLFGSQTTTAWNERRVAQTAQFAAASAERIERHIRYALSQKNNHGISEAAGLFTTGLIFPGLTHSERWVQTGRRLLEQQAATLIYADGAFAQHSGNYHRLMLQILLWCVRLGELNGVELSRPCRDAAKRSSDFLYQLVDVESGQIPNYGENDGALPLPLSASHQGDYRPVLQSAAMLLEGSRRFPPGPWDEEAMWMSGGRLPENDVPVATTPAELRGGPGGCHTMRAGAENLAFIRCPEKYNHRPAHADALHVDIWWRGINIAMDAGTYSYNAAPPWDHPLARAQHHNTVTVDEQEPMERASRFLWTDWHSSRVNTRPDLQGDVAVWEGSHDGYRRAARRLAHGAEVCFRRAIARIGQEHWLVIDDLCSDAEHKYRLHWLLNQAPYDWLRSAPSTNANRLGAHRLGLETAHGDYHIQFVSRAAADDDDTSQSLELNEACENSPVGWHCPSYGVRRPALSVSSVATTARVQFFTLFGPPPAELCVPRCADRSVRVRLPTGEATMLLCPNIFDRPSSTPPTTWDKRPLICAATWRASRKSASECRSRQAAPPPERMAS